MDSKFDAVCALNKVVEFERYFESCIKEMRKASKTYDCFYQIQKIFIEQIQKECSSIGIQRDIDDLNLKFYKEKLKKKIEEFNKMYTEEFGINSNMTFEDFERKFKC